MNCYAKGPAFSLRNSISSHRSKATCAARAAKLRLRMLCPCSLPRFLAYAKVHTAHFKLYEGTEPRVGRDTQWRTSREYFYLQMQIRTVIQFMDPSAKLKRGTRAGEQFNECLGCELDPRAHTLNGDNRQSWLFPDLHKRCGLHIFHNK